MDNNESEKMLAKIMNYVCECKTTFSLILFIREFILENFTNSQIKKIGYRKGNKENIFENSFMSKTF